MKKIIGFIIAALLISSMTFTGCVPKDNEGPKIYLLGTNGKPLPAGKNDTILLLHSKYVDPGIIYDDNKTKTENIVVTSNFEDLFGRNNGYVRRTGDMEIVYNATDDDGNPGEAVRKLTVKNPSDPFASSFTMQSRETTQLPVENISYNVNITAINNVAGAIRFPRVYYHKVGEQDVYYPVIAYLYSEKLSKNFSSTVGYLGKSTQDYEIPFYENSYTDPVTNQTRNMTYKEATEALVSEGSQMRILYLKIPGQEVTDPFGNIVSIDGREDNTGRPLSYIEYLGNEPWKYHLYLQVGSDAGVIEHYVKRYADDL